MTSNNEYSLYKIQIFRHGYMYYYYGSSRNPQQRLRVHRCKVNKKSNVGKLYKFCLENQVTRDMLQMTIIDTFPDEHSCKKAENVLILEKREHKRCLNHNLVYIDIDMSSYMKQYYLSNKDKIKNRALLRYYKNKSKTG